MILGVFGAFAPRVESALAGAGWQDSGSQSIQARNILGKEFAGLNSTALQVVIHDTKGQIATDRDAQNVMGQATALLQRDARISTVIAPQPGLSLSRDGQTAIIQAGAKADANTMVRAADDLAKPLRALSGGAVTVELTGSSALWADFNRVNHSAMIRSEVLSWPVTMIVLFLAFGSLVAAGLPLMLTLVGLLTAAGALVLSTHLAPVSIWAMNFAMMFALARREAEPDPRQAALDAVAETMGTAGKAVAFSGLTVLVSLSTVLLVPSPAFRSMSLGIMLAVVAVLAATLTLLPAVLGKLGNRVDAGRIHLPGALDRAEHRTQKRLSVAAANSPQASSAEEVHNGSHPHLHHSITGLERLLHHWGALLHRRPWVAAGIVALLIGAMAWRVTSLRTGMPSIAVIPQSETARAGYNEVVSAFGPGAPGMLSVLTPLARQDQAQAALHGDSGVAAVLPAGRSNMYALTLVMPTTDASAKATGATIDRLRTELPPSSMVGGGAAENHDLETVLASRTPLVFGLLIGLGFLLLLVALGSPLVAFVGVLSNLASIAAAFGVAKLIFQDGHLSGLLNFEPQGFADAWGPLFFGAMLSGVAMDYTLFLLSAAREHYDLTGDPQHAMRMALRTSGRVVVAAAGVMVAVFLTFALSGPLAPKEMGIIMAVAVFVDALLIRMVLLPVVLRLTGHAAWHRPAWLDKVLPQVHFSH